MKTIPILLSALLFLQTQKTIPQAGYEYGYVVTNNNDSIFGQIKDRKQNYSTRIYKKIRLKKHILHRKKYSPNQIKAYSIGNRTYESIWLQSKGFLFWERHKSIEDSGKKVFMKVIVKGTLSYYQYEYTDHESGTVGAIDFFKRETNSEFIRATHGIFGLRKKALTNYFSDCPKAAEKIKDGAFKYPIEIVEFYNSNCE